MDESESPTSFMFLWVQHHSCSWTKAWSESLTSLMFRNLGQCKSSKSTSLYFINLGICKVTSHWSCSYVYENRGHCHCWWYKAVTDLHIFSLIVHLWYMSSDGRFISEVIFLRSTVVPPVSVLLCRSSVGPLLMERDVGPLIILHAPSVVMSEPTPPHGLRESRREEQRK